MSAVMPQYLPDRCLSIEKFAAGDIDPEVFDHESHVFMGWLYANEFELSEAIQRFDCALKALVSKIGAEGKYHATITWFFLILIAERKQGGESWPDFKLRNTDLLDNSKDLLASFYSEKLLQSDRAREQFLLPDRL